MVNPNITKEDEDWIGIHATRNNAQFVRTIFQDIAWPEIVTFPGRKLETNYPVVVGAGYKPGNSTDYIAVKMAQVNGVKRVINLSNIPYAYDKDPKKQTDAKRLIDIHWGDFRKIVGDKWIPGMNTPFDPIASILAEEHNMTVIIADGKNLSNLEAILSGRAYRGTTISPKR